MIYNRIMEFRWDEETKTGFLIFKGRTFEIHGHIDPFNCRMEAEKQAEQRGWKRPPDKIWRRIQSRN